MGGNMRARKSSKKIASYNGNMKGAMKQKMKKINRSGGWFTKEDAKSVTKAVIGRFYNN